MNGIRFFNRCRYEWGCLVLFLFSTVQLSSQSFPASTYTLENGLYTNFAHDAAQDKQGRLWFTTGVGVLVYDGYLWKNYGGKDRLLRTEYFQIKIDSSNNIITVPYHCTVPLAIFKNDKWSFIRNLPSSLELGLVKMLTNQLAVKILIEPNQGTKIQILSKEIIRDN